MSEQEKSFRDLIHKKLEEKHSTFEEELKKKLEDIESWQYTGKHKNAIFVVSRVKPGLAGAWRDAANKLGFCAKIRKSSSADAGAGAKDLIVYDKPFVSKHVVIEVVDEETERDEVVDAETVEETEKKEE